MGAFGSYFCVEIYDVCTLMNESTVYMMHGGKRRKESTAKRKYKKYAMQIFSTCHRFCLFLGSPPCCAPLPAVLSSKWSWLTWKNVTQPDNHTSLLCTHVHIPNTPVIINTLSSRCRRSARAPRPAHPPRRRPPVQAARAASGCPRCSPSGRTRSSRTEALGIN